MKSNISDEELTQIVQNAMSDLSKTVPLKHNEDGSWTLDISNVDIEALNPIYSTVYNRKEAIILLMDGYKVKYNDWDSHEYIFYDEAENTCYDEKGYEFTFSNLREGNWTVVREEKKSDVEIEIIRMLLTHKDNSNISYVAEGTEEYFKGITDYNTFELDRYVIQKSRIERERKESHYA